MKTVFIRANEASADEKAAVLRSASQRGGSYRYQLNPQEFAQVPRSPFAYWAADESRACFTRFIGLANHQSIKVVSTNPLNEDFRYARLFWEPCASLLNSDWLPWAKGGSFSAFYYDIHTVISWSKVRFSYGSFIGTPNRPLTRPASVQHFFRPGLTWPRRTNGLSFRVLPSGCIFADKGPAIFVEDDDCSALLALCAVVNSGPFGALVALQLARTELAQSFEVGLIQQTPVPAFGSQDTTELAHRAWRSWSLRRHLDFRTENSHAFSLPALLQMAAVDLKGRAESYAFHSSSVQTELEAISKEIDDHAYRLYGISEEDRQRIEQGFGIAPESDEVEAADAEDSDEEVAEVDAFPMVASLLSWCLGVAFGRFDVRLATGERSLPPEPEPFDPLPVCSPGMLSGDDGLPLSQPPAGYPLAFPADGLLVDDPGHPQDLSSAVRSVFEVVFDDPDARWKEAAELLGCSELRSWFACEFFGPHIKRYSKSRRKAPIYWQFATPSGSYSVWLYIHRATGDSLFRVLELVSQKLRHEEGKHAALVQEAGPSPSPSQRRELEQQESFLGELRGLKAEVARVAPLWKPDLDDGVLLNFAPLWRLVPQLSSWQTECRSAWDKLVAEHYHWAHLAMHLWPERVVPKCQADRSLAIAHGLEEPFWLEDADGTWRQRDVAEATVQQLIAERTSTTVKAALQDLLAAPAPLGRSSRRATRAPRSSAPRPRAASSGLDPAVLSQVQAAIAAVPDGVSRADVLAATGISAAQWTAAIRALLASGSVTQTGDRRSARYHRSGGSTP